MKKKLYKKVSQYKFVMLDRAFDYCKDLYFLCLKKKEKKNFENRTSKFGLLHFFFFFF